MRTVVVANKGDEDAGYVGEHLAARGAVLEIWHRRAFATWASLTGVDLVVTLGSNWSVYWDKVAEPVAAECDLIRSALHADIPVLAICFGAQVAAHALGGEVARAPEAEVGWFDVESAVPALAGSWFEWHYDRFVPPPDATVLADSPRATQAFSLGSLCAVQFHPEVNPAIVTEWSSGSGVTELTDLRIDADELLARTRAEAPRARAACGDLLDWWLSAG